MTQNYQRSTIDPTLYENDPTRPLGKEEIISYVSDRPNEYIPYTGILIHIQGATYPKKGFPTPESVAAIGVVKALVMRSLHHPALFLFSSKAQLLVSFNAIFNKAMGPYKIKEMYLCPAAYNFALFIKEFLTSLGLPTSLSYDFAFNFAHVLEYDDAYRYRFQDIISEASYGHMYENPRKELKRLLTMFADRHENKGNKTPEKIRKIVTPLLLLLLIPKYKRAFLQSCWHLFNMGYDEADRYWACLKGDDYQFTGRSYEERTKGLKIPQAVRIIYETQ